MFMKFYYFFTKKIGYTCDDYYP